MIFVFFCIAPDCSKEIVGKKEKNMKNKRIVYTNKIVNNIAFSQNQTKIINKFSLKGIVAQNSFSSK